VRLRLKAYKKKRSDRDACSAREKRLFKSLRKVTKIAGSFNSGISKNMCRSVIRVIILLKGGGDTRDRARADML